MSSIWSILKGEQTNEHEDIIEFDYYYDDDDHTSLLDTHTHTYSFHVAKWINYPI